MGFQRGAGGFEFRSLSAWGKKLLSSQAERALMLRYPLPDGRSWKRLWEGWVGSFTILVALVKHRARKMSRMEGRGAPIIFEVLFTVRWRVSCTTVPIPDSDAAGQHALNDSSVESGEDGWRETCSFQPTEKVLALLRLLGE